MDTRSLIFRLALPTAVFAFVLPFLGLVHFTGGIPVALGLSALMSIVLLALHSVLSGVINSMFTDAIMGIKKHKHEDLIFWTALVALFFAPGAVLFGASFLLPLTIHFGILGLLGVSALVSLPMFFTLDR